jgi:hypothetical protein
MVECEGGNEMICLKGPFIISAAALHFVLLTSLPCAAQATNAPAVGDLIGRWDEVEPNKDKSFLVLDNDSTRPGKLLATTKAEKVWRGDEHIDPSTGVVYLSRLPSAAELENSLDPIPLWAREKVENHAIWKLELSANKGSDDKCALTLSGPLARVKIEYNEADRTAKVKEGADAYDRSLKFGFVKRWYDPPSIDERVSFKFADPVTARNLLGDYGSDERVISDLNSASMEIGAEKMARSLLANVFKAATYALPLLGTAGAIELWGESILAQIAQNLVENAIGNVIEGDPIGKEMFVEALAATLTSVFVGRIVSVDPGYYEELSKSLGEDFGEKVVGPLADQLKTKEELNARLEKKFLDQCRFQIRTVTLARNISGFMIVDRGKHLAQLVLYVPRSEKNIPGIVTGVFDFATNEGGGQAPSRAVFLNVLPRPDGR